jgi:ferredoxin
VHRRAVHARCDACVRICPRQAWGMDAGGLAFDAQACDGCGLCEVACPTGALHVGGQPTGADAGGMVPLRRVACRPGWDRQGLTAPTAAVTVLPCLHALDEARLLDWHRSGTRRLAAVHGDCGQCPRGRRLLPSQTLRARLDRLDRAQRSRGRPGWFLHSITSSPVRSPGAHPATGGWPLSSAAVSAPPPSASRRALFGLGRSHPAPVAPTSADVLPARERANRQLQCLGHGPAGRAGSTGLALWAVRLEASNCDACGACATLCPTGAISIACGAGGSPGTALAAVLRLSMGACVGCGLCVDVCSPGALAPAEPVTEPVAEHRLNMTNVKCAHCGKAYRALRGRQGADGGVCPACRSAAPRRRDRVVQAATDLQAPGPSSKPN